MAKSPQVHKYSDLGSFNRLLLLIAAIALNPLIASQRDPDPMGSLLKAMKQIAKDQGIEWQEWSANTIKADLKTLREYGILPSGTALRAGYYLGVKQNIRLPPKSPKDVKPRKAKLTVEEMQHLRNNHGKTIAEIAEVAGVSKQRVSQLLK